MLVNLEELAQLESLKERACYLSHKQLSTQVDIVDLQPVLKIGFKTTEGSFVALQVKGNTEKELFEAAELFLLEAVLNEVH